jgi:hypothetical protein
MIFTQSMNDSIQGYIKIKGDKIFAECRFGSNISKGGYEQCIKVPSDSKYFKDDKFEVKNVLYSDKSIHLLEVNWRGNVTFIDMFDMDARNGYIIFYKMESHDHFLRELAYDELMKFNK